MLSIPRKSLFLPPCLRQKINKRKRKNPRIKFRLLSPGTKFNFDQRMDNFNLILKLIDFNFNQKLINFNFYKKIDSFQFLSNVNQTGKSVILYKWIITTNLVIFSIWLQLCKTVLITKKLQLICFPFLV